MLAFLIAAVAGFLTPQLEETVGSPIIKMLGQYVTVDPVEKRVITFMALMLVVTIAAAILGSGGPFWIMFGAVLGYFGTRLVEAFKKLTDNGAE